MSNKPDFSKVRQDAPKAGGSSLLRLVDPLPDEDDTSFLERLADDTLRQNPGNSLRRIFEPIAKAIKGVLTRIQTLENSLAEVSAAKVAAEETAARLQAEIVVLQQDLIEVSQNSLTDHLTQIPNRRYYEVRLDAALQAVLRHPDQKIAVVFIDLDDFKGINDAYGHDAGDAALREVAGRLHRSTRKDECAGRIGGDEFALLLIDDNDRHDFPQLAIKRLHDQVLSDLAMDYHGQRVPMRASIGVSVMDQERIQGLQPAAESAGMTLVQAVMVMADREMYERKAARKSTPMIGAAPESLAL
jgi:diguanylate cyclase (GGDEF)-like protein